MGLRSKEQVQGVTHEGSGYPASPPLGRVPPPSGAEGARVIGSSPLPDRRRGLRPAVTNAITSPHHSPGLLPAEDRGFPWREAMRCPGPARLSYRGHQLLPAGEIWDERGAERAVLHSPGLCQATRPQSPRPQLPCPQTPRPQPPSCAAAGVRPEPGRGTPATAEPMGTKSPKPPFGTRDLSSTAAALLIPPSAGSPL